MTPHEDTMSAQTLAKPPLRERLDAFFGQASLPCRLNTAGCILASRFNLARGCPTPWMLQLEVTNRCNLDCVFCSRHVAELQLGDMSAELQGKVVALSRKVQETALFGYGEPLMSRAFYDLLPRLQSSRIGFFTNGLLLNEALLQKILSLAARPLAYIVFSIDGATTETYEGLRRGSNFATVLANLEAVVALRKRLNLRRPILRIEFVAMRRNIRELPALLRLMDRIGVDGVKVSHLVVWDESLRDESLVYDMDLCREVFDEVRSLAPSLRIWVDLPKTLGQTEATHRPPCRWPWHYAMVSYEGEVRACCFDPTLVMGDLRRDSFKDIWNSARYAALRGTVNGPIPPRGCLTCEELYRYVASPDEERTYVKLTPRRK